MQIETRPGHSWLVTFRNPDDGELCTALIFGLPGIAEVVKMAHFDAAIDDDWEIVKIEREGVDYAAEDAV